MKSVKMIALLLFVGGGAALIISLRSVELVDEISKPKTSHEVNQNLTRQESVVTEGDPAAKAEVTHKRISRKFAQMDRIVLGEFPHVDSKEMVLLLRPALLQKNLPGLLLLLMPIKTMLTKILHGSMRRLLGMMSIIMLDFNKCR